MTTRDEAEKARREVDAIREEIKRTEKKLSDKQRVLAEIERGCHHDWGNVVPDHIYHEAYTCPGDPPGTMGVDWRGPVHVPSRTEHRWKRTCRLCGKVEYTSRTKDKVEKIPVF
jgi:hypothetical protein